MSTESRVWRLTAICSALHLLVDGLCVCCLYLLAFGLCVHHLLALFITYNVLAFLTQPLAGIVADSLQHRHWLLLSAVVLLALAVLSTVAFLASALPAAAAAPSPQAGSWSFPVAVMLGLGNSLFHVWGGKQVAVATGNDARALGMFVSTGVLGLALGGVFFSLPLLCLFLLSASLLAVACLHCDPAVSSPAAPSPAVVPHLPLGRGVVVLCVLLLMCAVMLRSYAGQGFSLASGGSSAMVLTVAVVCMAGKMSGGWMARRCGMALSLVLMVSVAVLCLALLSPALCPFPGWLAVRPFTAVAVALAGAFAVNATMPVTLFLANAVLPGREGLAFGLLAAALIPGYLLAVL